MKAVTIDGDELSDIQEMLLVGLAAFAEVDRIHTMIGQGRDRERLRNDDLLPLHPTANNDTLRDFANTLRMVNAHLQTAHRGDA